MTVQAVLWRLLLGVLWVALTAAAFLLLDLYT
jgi:hypothetical protein